MKINFTKKQYKQLIEIVYLGEWMANATQVAPERDQDFHEIFQYVFSFAENFHYDHLIEYDRKFDQYMPTLEFEENLDPYIHQYDHDSFWQDLPNRLAKRDIDQSGETFSSREDFMKRLFEIESHYEKEFAENGLKNLVVKKENFDK